MARASAVGVSVFCDHKIQPRIIGPGRTRAWPSGETLVMQSTNKNNAAAEP
ncbi:MAG: hypothetical protein GY750_09405 [Lentisphaerae bacterium]|nr:hypothetical protein [Lentisphaerota bacterium]MCP4101628.1 hypothetical protein [Lentisphaerota bacterium]